MDSGVLCGKAKRRWDVLCKITVGLTAIVAGSPRCTIYKSVSKVRLSWLGNKADMQEEQSEVPVLNSTDRGQLSSTDADKQGILYLTNKTPAHIMQDNQKNR